MKILNATSHLVFPFSFASDYCMSERFLSEWRAEAPKGNLDVLLPQVRNVIGDNCNLQEYGYKSGSEVRQKLFANPMKTIIEDKEVQFTLSAPRLMICPDQKVGILVIGIKYTESKKGMELATICDHTYHLRKLDHMALTMTISYDGLKRALERPAPADKVLIKGRELDALRRDLGLDNVEEKYILRIKLSQIISLLLRDFSEINYYNPNRANVFSYLSGRGYILSRNDKSDIIRMIHGFGPKYHVDPYTFDEQMLRTFDDVVIGVSTECAVILTHTAAESTSAGFFMEFSHSSLPRYFYIYLLVVLQQQIQISISKQLIDLDEEREHESVNQIMKIYRNVANTQSAFHFVDISSYHHLNRYYHYCMDKLNVESYYKSALGKIADLYSVSDRILSIRRYKVNALLTILVGIITFFSAVDNIINILIKNCWICRSDTIAIHTLTIGALAIGILCFIAFYKKLR